MQMQRMDVWTLDGVGGGESETNWEISIDVYTLPSVK